VIPDQAAKSIGAEETFDEDLEAHELGPAIHAQALRVGRRLRKAGVKGRVVQLKIKLADFTLLTRRMTLDEATDDGQALYRAAAELLAREKLPRRVRLTGVAAHDLSSEGSAPQLGLFRSGPTRADRLNAALDQIAAKFGSDAVVPADVADKERPEVEVRNDRRQED
jgi:DNA polymerase-4